MFLTNPGSIPPRAFFVFNNFDKVISKFESLLWLIVLDYRGHLDEVLQMSWCRNLWINLIDGILSNILQVIYSRYSIVPLLFLQLNAIFQLLRINTLTFYQILIIEAIHIFTTRNILNSKKPQSMLQSKNQVLKKNKLSY